MSVKNNTLNVGVCFLYIFVGGDIVMLNIDFSTDLPSLLCPCRAAKKEYARGSNNTPRNGTDKLIDTNLNKTKPHVGVFQNMAFAVHFQFNIDFAPSTNTKYLITFTTTGRSLLNKIPQPRTCQHRVGHKEIVLTLSLTQHPYTV